MQLGSLRSAPCLGIVLILELAGFLSVHIRAQESGKPPSAATLTPRTTRSSPLDLELGGDLAGVPAGSTRYLRREELLRLPQVTYTVTDDANFKGAPQVSGVLLEDLTAKLSAEPKSDMAIALCSDLYRANYPDTYIAAHHPLLVLNINGQPPSEWRKDPDGQGFDMGPYLISHAKFVPAFQILSHSDEPQIPWGVIRLEFRNEAKTFAVIAPRGAQAKLKQVQDGYRIAGQNCFRCHNNGSEGGQKAGHPWQVLSAWAVASPEYFAAYVRDPKSKNPHSQMQGNPNYDDATLQSLIAYFRTFQAQVKP